MFFLCELIVMSEIILYIWNLSSTLDLSVIGMWGHPRDELKNIINCSSLRFELTLYTNFINICSSKDQCDPNRPTASQNERQTAELTFSIHTWTVFAQTQWKIYWSWSFMTGMVFKGLIWLRLFYISTL